MSLKHKPSQTTIPPEVTKAFIRLYESGGRKIGRKNMAHAIECYAFYLGGAVAAVHDFKDVKGVHP